MRRLVAAGLVVLLVAGVGGWLLTRTLADGEEPAAEPWAEAPDEVGAQDVDDPSLERFYRQRLRWEPCGDKDCARLTVPLDYERPRGRTIELALLRARALGPARGALVFNPGGPGAPGTTYVEQAGQLFGVPLRRAYDIIGFDPRGTGDSAPIDCLSDAELDEFLAVDGSPDDPAEVRALTGWLDRFGRGCVEGDPQLAAHVSTIETARDIDVLRAALGQAELDYLGASYGTGLGATYAELFPDRVGRLVLDGAVDVTLTTREANLGQARGFQDALESYVADCVDNVDGCYLGDSVQAGLDRIATLLAEVDRSPLPTASGRPMTVGHAVYGIALPLYDRGLWFLLSQALRTAVDGDGTALLALADLYASRTPGGEFTDNSREAFWAISCLDEPTAATPEQVRRQLGDFREASPTFGDFFAWSMVSCRGQVAESTEPDLEIDGSGAPPILVLGTTRDPATPYAWAQALADQLDSGVLLTRDGDGHTAYHSGNDCVDDAVEAFLVDGVVPDAGLTC